MWATVAFLCGVIFAGVVLAVFRIREPGSASPSARSTVIGWLTLTLGVIAATAFGVGTFTQARIGGNLVSIACAAAAVIIGVGAVLRGDRCWPTWVGLAAGVIPGAFWIAFAVGNILDLGN